LRAAAVDRHFSADHAGDALGHLVLDLTRHATGDGSILGFADAFADAVRNLSRSCLLYVTASRVGNLFRVAFLNPMAGRVRNLLRVAFLDPTAGRVRNPSGLALADVAASGVGHFASFCFANHAAAGVRYAFGNGTRNLLTHCVGNLAVLHFGDVPRAADLLFDGLGNPDSLAASRAGALNLDRLACAGLVDAAATGSIPFPRSRLANALVDDRTGNVLGDRLPLAAADLNFFAFRDRLTNRVAVVAVAGFLDGLVGRAADVAIMRRVNRLAHGVTLVAVAGFVNRLAHGVADVAVAGFVNRPATFAGDFPVAGFVNRLADLAAHFTIASLVDRLANGVTLVAVARLVDVLPAFHRNLFADCVVDRLGACIFFFLPHGFLHRLIAWGATCLRSAIISRGDASLLRTATVTGCSTIAGERARSTTGDHQQDGQDGSSR